MKFSAALILAGASLALASPTPSKTLEKRADSCGQWDTVQTGTFTVYNNLWGQSSGSGSQCTGVDSASGNNIKWHTSWSWSGGQGQVKSYANVAKQFTSKIVSQYSSLQSSWSWTYTGSNLVADVAYDLFTNTAAGATSNPQYEIMIWLAALGGAGPISATGSPIATPTIAGQTWKLYYGLNGSMKVYSFVAPSSVTNFSGDLKAFFTYLSSSQGFPISSQYLVNLQAGTEPFSGSNAKLTSTYSATVA